MKEGSLTIAPRAARVAPSCSVRSRTRDEEVVTAGKRSRMVF
jgi:hypothetical protein